MSLVIAIKDKNRVVLGADKQVSAGDSKEHTITKIWEVEELPGAIMGSVGSARVSQIIQYQFKSWLKLGLVTTGGPLLLRATMAILSLSRGVGT